MNYPILDLSGVAWTNAGSATYDDDAETAADSCLLGTVQISRAVFHAQAIRVVSDGNGIQEAEDPALEGDYDYARRLCADGPLMTVKIDGHEGDYVVVIYPHAN